MNSMVHSEALSCDSHSVSLSRIFVNKVSFLLSHYYVLDRVSSHRSVAEVHYKRPRLPRGVPKNPTIYFRDGEVYQRSTSVSYISLSFTGCSAAGLFWELLVGGKGLR